MKSTKHYFTFGQEHVANVRLPNGGRLADYWVTVIAEADHREIFLLLFTGNFCPKLCQFASEYLEDNFDPKYFPGGELASFTMTRIGDETTRG